MKKHTNFTLTTFRKNKSEIIDTAIGGILLVILLLSLLFLFSLFAV